MLQIIIALEQETLFFFYWSLCKQKVTELAIKNIPHISALVNFSELQSFSPMITRHMMLHLLQTKVQIKMKVLMNQNDIF